MKKLMFSITFAICCAATVNLIAQDESNTKTRKVTIKKDGKNVSGVKTIVIDSQKSAEWIENNMDGNSKTIWVDEEDGVMTISADKFAFIPDEDPGDKKVSVNVEKEMENGVVKRTVTIDIEENGNQEKIKWVDNGALPDEIKKMLDEKGISLSIIEGNGEGEKMEITIDDSDNESATQKKIIKKEMKKAYKIKSIDDDGTEKVLEWDGDGEMPAEMKKMMDELDIDLDQEIYEMLDGDNGHKVMIKKHKMIKSGEEGNNNKAMLGVQINDDGSGVMIEDVFAKTGAEKAGLQQGDVINSVNGKLIIDIEALVNSLSGAVPGDQVNLGILRAGKQHSIDVKMSPMDMKAKGESEKEHSKKKSKK